MIPFLQVFEEKVYNQYLLVALAVLLVILIKLWMANKAYKRKLVSFIHPDTVLPDLKKKIKSVNEAQSLLAFNILKVVQDLTRLRNIAFLIRCLKQYGIPLKPLQKKIAQTFSKLDKEKLSKVDKTYKQYILSQINQEDNKCVNSKKKDDVFYTI